MLIDPVNFQTALLIVILGHLIATSGAPTWYRIALIALVFIISFILNRMMGVG